MMYSQYQSEKINSSKLNVIKVKQSGILDDSDDDRNNQLNFKNSYINKVSTTPNQIVSDKFKQLYEDEVKKNFQFKNQIQNLQNQLNNVKCFIFITYY